MPAFPTPSGRPASILGLFAHPDDEVFCLGGTMAKCVADGGSGKIVSLTRGAAGQIRDAGVASRSTLGSVREHELRRSANILGVADVECCEYRDGTLAHQPLEPLIEHATRIVDSFAPDVVISFGADGAYGHPDHVAVSEIATAAAARSETRPAMLHAVFPRRSNLLVQMLVEWLSSLDERFMGSEEFAHGLMLFADGSSMLGYAADHLGVRFYPAGTFIIEQGEPPGELFLVLSGSVDVVHESVSGRTLLGTSGPGSFVGEDGIALGQPRNADVVANTSVTCLVLSPNAASSSAGRGGSATGLKPDSPHAFQSSATDLIEVDVSGYWQQKIRALACHRTQYAIDAEMFPQSLVEGIFGIEYFAKVDLG